MAQITKGKVFEFMKENIVTANDRRIACGDGRYNPEQSNGAIRMFGADMGAVMAIAATLKDKEVYIDPSEIVDRYTKAKQELLGEDAVLDYHCDEHSHHVGNIGCGHIGKAANAENDGKYGSLNHQDVSDLFDAFTQSPASHLTVLEGDHQEEGVLFVHSAPEKKADYSVNSKDRKGRMFFVVDLDRVKDYLSKVTQLFSKGISTPLDSADVFQNYSTQMGATARILKADQLPWFKVEVGEGLDFRMEQLPQKRTQASV